MKKGLIEKFFLLAIILSPLYLARFTVLTIPTNLHEILVILCIILFFSNRDRYPFLDIFKKNKLLYVGTFLLLLGLILSVIINGINVHSLGIVKSWFIIPILFALILPSIFKDQKNISVILLALFFSISAVSIISLLAFAGGIKTYDGRLEGIYNSPNYLAMFLAPGVFIWFFIRYAKDTVSKSRIHSFFLRIGFASILIALYLTYSYAAWVSIFISLLPIARLKKVLARKIALAIGMIFLCFVIFQSDTQKLKSLIKMDHRSSFESRVMIWKSSGKMLADHPLFGIGSGNFQQKYLEYQKFFSPYLEWAVPHPHNLILSFWLFSGSLGLIGFILILFEIFKNIILNKKKDDATSLFFAVVLSYFSYVVIHGIFDTTYWKNDLSFIFWLFAFLAISRSIELPERNSIEPSVNPIDKK